MTIDREELQVELAEPGPQRIWYVGDAFAKGFSLEEVHELEIVVVLTANQGNC